ncbi:DEAD/DEAH box helicase family protein [Tenacibaculum aestuarii]|uniref:DEAD/DEAH box helicase family protein n=1 Tax=Tenacibaculum aestuarii TaxID=362781 RepID=UPI0038948F97
MAFLFDTLIREFGKREISRTIVPNYIVDNLKYEIRPYQNESFQRFLLCYNEEFDGKPNKPFHLLFNMATGSGKTLIMAGLILYLYKQGYRNFLFFVNSNNIITKTKENFINPIATKYLFKNKIVIDGKEVVIKDVENFNESDSENININFTTIQQLHLDLNNSKENSITYEDFRDKKIALIADEAHHLSSATKNKGQLFGSWEGTVIEILNQNYNNVLLEFTATLDYESREIADKYQDKVIQKYDLAQFRVDKYSKEINLIRSYYEEEKRILQALILNLYRQELAATYNINLKPVVLFKAKSTIKESEENKTNFHRLIDNLSVESISEIEKTSTVKIVQKAFNFFNNITLTKSDIVKRIKSNFKEENCISANNDKEAELNQIRLNTLEDENNPIRAVFAVQKLNEGWDVLNLFDIVRLYEGQNTGGSNTKIGKTTLSEAQLIGRGARYFPFNLEEGQDKYKRKYDDEVSNDLKVLEELYYHTKEDNRYISELKKALVESGIYEDEDNLVTKKLILKPHFKKTEFFKKGRVVFNKKIEKSYNNVKSFLDFGVAKKSFEFTLSSGIGAMSGVFVDDEVKTEKMEQQDLPVQEIPPHIIRFAISQNPFFYYENLIKYFPNIESISNFITSENYLNGLEIILKGTPARLLNVSNTDYLLAIQSLLQKIESEIKNNLIEFEGSQYINKYIHEVFKDKEIRVSKGSERELGQEEFLEDKDWYVFNANYGTSEEKEFVKMFSRRFKTLNQTFENIYLFRNEREIKIIDKVGRAFEPDFILFCKKNAEEELTYQVFIEPKGKHLKAHDKWKEEFLKEIREEKTTLEIHSDKYLITGVPFYNNENENEFKETLSSILLN